MAKSVVEKLTAEAEAEKAETDAIIAEDEKTKKLSRNEIVSEIHNLLGAINYTDHNGHFDQTIGKVNRLLNQL